MATMNYYDYQALIEETPVNTFILEYRDFARLVGACIVDEMADGLSAVYSFFAPINKRKSLGSHGILALYEIFIFLILLRKPIILYVQNDLSP